MFFRTLLVLLLFLKVSLVGCAGCCNDDIDDIQFLFLDKRDNIFLKITQDFSRHL